jgi:hypothetical protein
MTSLQMNDKEKQGCCCAIKHIIALYHSPNKCQQENAIYLQFKTTKLTNKQMKTM